MAGSNARAAGIIRCLKTPTSDAPAGSAKPRTSKFSPPVYNALRPHSQLATPRRYSGSAWPGVSFRLLLADYKIAEIPSQIAPRIGWNDFPALFAVGVCRPTVNA